MRATERQEALLRQAAASSDMSLTEFILGRAITEAERVLADRRWFTSDEAQFAEFTRLLEAPLPSTEKLERTMDAVWAESCSAMRSSGPSTSAAASARRLC